MGPYPMCNCDGPSRDWQLSLGWGDLLQDARDTLCMSESLPNLLFRMCFRCNRCHHLVMFIGESLFYQIVQVNG
jgi:hypothetical protein